MCVGLAVAVALLCVGACGLPALDGGQSDWLVLHCCGCCCVLLRREADFLRQRASKKSKRASTNIPDALQSRGRRNTILTVLLYLLDPQSIVGLLLVPSAACLGGLEPPPPPVTSLVATEHWLNVRLNHFDASNTKTFPMRFYYNNLHGGPHVVIMVGGDWPISGQWTQAGLANELASMVGAGVFYIEHRYYGQSTPGNDTSVEELRYLTLDQSLADLAQFIQHVKSPRFEHGQYQSGSVVVVGCAAAGSLATWMRVQYPHLVDAVFSDSGPLRAQEDFPEYLEVVSKALKEQGGDGCLSAVEESMTALVELLATANGPASVTRMFDTCSLVATTPLDLATFFWFGVIDHFARLVQHSAPGDIEAACDVLADSSADPVQRLATWIRSQTTACIETRYPEVAAAYSNTSYDSTHASARLWMYQSCVQYGWFQSTTSPEQPFLSTVPVEYFQTMCKDFFSNTFDERSTRAGIERTNLFLGALTLPDHVVTVSGTHDPWSPVTPQAAHQTHHSPVYVVPNVSQCRAIRPTSESETDELSATQQKVLSFLHKAVTGQSLEEVTTPSRAGRSFASIALLVCLLPTFL